MIEEHPEVRNRDHSKLVKIRFPLLADDQAQGVEAELLWAEPIAQGQYRLENSPFYVYGISFQDVVWAEERDQNLNFSSVASRGGHSTYRILIESAEGYEGDEFRTQWIGLAALGCSYEVAKRRWLAIDVPVLTDVFAVYALLEEGERAGIWTFEEGYCGHSLERTTKQ